MRNWTKDDSTSRVMTDEGGRTLATVTEDSGGWYVQLFPPFGGSLMLATPYPSVWAARIAAERAYEELLSF
jgi:hypothetical protein